jgi:hypothetical protein
MDIKGLEPLQIAYNFLKAKVHLKQNQVFASRESLDAAKHQCKNFFGEQSEKLTQILMFENRFYLSQNMLFEAYKIL